MSKSLGNEIARLEKALAKIVARLQLLYKKRDEKRAKLLKRVGISNLARAGHARAASLTPERRSEIAALAAKARWQKK